MTDDLTIPLLRILASIETTFGPLSSIEDETSWFDQFEARLTDLGVNGHALATLVDQVYDTRTAEAGAFVVGFVAGIEYQAAA